MHSYRNKGLDPEQHICFQRKRLGVMFLSCSFLQYLYCSKQLIKGDAGYLVVSSHNSRKFLSSAYTCGWKTSMPIQQLLCSIVSHIKCPSGLYLYCGTLYFLFIFFMWRLEVKGVQAPNVDSCFILSKKQTKCCLFLLFKISWCLLVKLEVIAVYV